ncbi:MAG: hypothetical protein HQ559_13455, partial [Lentisphaerae bacterium]|nr:hypothetical protein [Lentisphaerota bacterium]
EDSLQMAWKLANGGDHGLALRAVQGKALAGVPSEVSGLPAADSVDHEAARAAIMKCIQDSCGAALSDAVTIQAKHSADFMVTPACNKGRIGAEFSKTMAV